MTRVLFLLPCLVFAQPDAVTKVAEGVWMREGDLKGKGHCNNAVIEMKDYLVVVDANFPSGAQALLADLNQLSPKPVKYVLLTHHHGDHAYGSAVWTKLGVTTVAHAAVVEEMKRYEPKRWNTANREDVKALGVPTLEPPKQTFDKSPWVLDDGSRRVEFWHFGWGHTRGDGYVYLPKEKVLVTGDGIVNGAFNFTGDAHLQNWPKALEALKRKLPVTHVIPGHGPAGGPAVIDGQIAFLRALVATAKKYKKTEDLAAVKSDALPAAVQNWAGQNLKTQLRDAWRELDAKKPAGDLEH